MNDIDSSMHDGDSSDEESEPSLEKIMINRAFTVYSYDKDKFCYFVKQCVMLLISGFVYELNNSRDIPMVLIGLISNYITIKINFYPWILKDIQKQLLVSYAITKLNLIDNQTALKAIVNEWKRKKLKYVEHIKLLLTFCIKNDNPKLFGICYGVLGTDLELNKYAELAIEHQCFDTLKYIVTHDDYSKWLCPTLLITALKKPSNHDILNLLVKTYKNSQQIGLADEVIVAAIDCNLEHNMFGRLMTIYSRKTNKYAFKPSIIEYAKALNNNCYKAIQNRLNEQMIPSMMDSDELLSLDAWDDEISEDDDDKWWDDDENN